MTEEDPPPSLEDLDVRLRAGRLKEEQRLGREASQEAAGASMGMAMRIAVEMISALIVTGAIGWALDEWLDTRPWLMLVMLIVGSATGLWNTYRSAMRIHREMQDDDAPGEDKQD